MNSKKINEILHSTDDFTNNMESYLTGIIMDDKNPFSTNEVNNRTLLNALIKCTLVIATMIYMLHRSD